MAVGCPPPPDPLPPPTEVVVKHPATSGMEVKSLCEKPEVRAKNPNNELTETNYELTEKSLELTDKAGSSKPSYACMVKTNMETKEAWKSEADGKDFHATCTIPDLKPSCVHEGKPRVEFMLEDMENYINEMKHVLIGKFSHGRPSIELIREFFINLKLKGAINISLSDSKHLIIECELLEDFTRLWLRNIWYIKSFPMRMFKWSLEFSPLKESPICPVWIHLPGLPLYLFNEEAMFSIANSIGKPLKIDHNNVKRIKLGTASLCVEIDVSKPIMDQTNVVFKDKDGKIVYEFWQKVEYDIMPTYCQKCSHLGHEARVCKRTEESQVKEGKEPVEADANSAKEQKFRRAPAYGRFAKTVSMDSKENEKKSTKQWVQKQFTADKVKQVVPQNTTMEVSNPFEALGEDSGTEVLEQGSNSGTETLEQALGAVQQTVTIMEVSTPVETLGADSGTEALEQGANSGTEPLVQTLGADSGTANSGTEIKRKNILAATDLPPASFIHQTSLVAGPLVPIIQEVDELSDIGVPYKFHSAPTSPTKKHQEEELNKVITVRGETPLING